MTFKCNPYIEDFAVVWLLMLGIYIYASSVKVHMAYRYVYVHMRASAVIYQ